MGGLDSPPGNDEIRLRRVYQDRDRCITLTAIAPVRTSVPKRSSGKAIRRKLVKKSSRNLYQDWAARGGRESSMKARCGSRGEGLVRRWPSLLSERPGAAWVSMPVVAHVGIGKGDSCPIFGRAWKPMTPPSAPSPKAFLNRIFRSCWPRCWFSGSTHRPAGWRWIFEAWLRCPKVFGILKRPEETESGSAGKQPDEGYSGRRCAKGAAEALGGQFHPGPFFCFAVF